MEALHLPQQSEAVAESSKNHEKQDDGNDADADDDPMMKDAVDVAAVADAVVLAQTVPTLPADPPTPLPVGWLLKPSHAYPGTYYYFHMDTGMTQWDAPSTSTTTANNNGSTTPTFTDSSVSAVLAAVAKQSNSQHDPKNNSAVHGSAPPDAKRQKRNTDEVRVLHILKKHKDSRRPSSWRHPEPMTHSEEDATEELVGLLDILLEEVGNPTELQATFEELARTESDCSSAKRGGDLGFFGRRKMQPAFEEASFALTIGELTRNVVVTSSGVHLILRIG